jgi:hypothetical protein
MNKAPRTFLLAFTSASGAHAAGDVLTNPKQIPEAFLRNTGTGYVVELTIWDKADNTAEAMDVYFSAKGDAIGDINGPVAIADADVANIFGPVQIASGDWKDIGGAKMATKTMTAAGMPLAISSDIGARAVYVTLVTQGTPDPGGTSAYVGRVRILDLI